MKQSSREWYFRLVTYLTPYGFAFSAFDPCVLVHSSGSLFIAIYVDDITLFGESNGHLEQTINLLKSEFKVNDMGDVHWLLGIRIDCDNAGIHLSQTAYIDRILNKFALTDCNFVSTPLDPNQQIRAVGDEDERTDTSLYQQIVRSINYLVTATRPDLAYTITHLSQYNSNPSKTHVSLVKRVLRYLKGTRKYTLYYLWGTELNLSGYSDASYGNCLDTTRSFSGYLFQLGEATICWRSRKQRSVAASTADAEYMALSLTVKQQIWLQRGLKEFLKQDIPSATFCDNQAADDIAHNPKINDRTKRIDIAYHFSREQVESGNITLLHVASKDNLADICTKSLARPIYNHLSTKIFGTK